MLINGCLKDCLRTYVIRIVITEIVTENATEETTLPETGMSGSHKVFAGLSALMGITGIGLVKKSRKEDEE